MFVKGLTPLHLALLSKTDVGLQIADALLENGADPSKAGIGPVWCAEQFTKGCKIIRGEKE